MNPGTLKRQAASKNQPRKVPGREIASRAPIPSHTGPSGRYDSIKEDGMGAGAVGGTPANSTSTVPTVKDPNVGYAFKRLRQKMNAALSRRVPPIKTTLT